MNRSFCHHIKATHPTLPPHLRQPHPRPRRHTSSLALLQLTTSFPHTEPHTHPHLPPKPWRRTKSVPKNPSMPIRSPYLEQPPPPTHLFTRSTAHHLHLHLHHTETNTTPLPQTSIPRPLPASSMYDKYSFSSANPSPTNSNPALSRINAQTDSS